MEVIDKTEKRSSIVDLVNPLVEEAFGKGFKGNYTHAHKSFVDGPSGLKTIGRLAAIARKGFLNENFAGQLGAEFGSESDGAVIAVFPAYEQQAKRYAELYKRTTGKDVTIILRDEINPVDARVMDPNWTQSRH